MNDKILHFKPTDRKSFIELINLLREDLIEDPSTWENKTLPDFLEALARYAEDIQGYYNNTNQNYNADEANWKVFSDIFIGASMYE